MENTNNITNNIHKVENLGYVSEKATLDSASIVMREKDEVTGKWTQLAEQFCEITGKKSRYLFHLTNASGVTKKVSATIAQSAGFTQKELDRVYTVGYYLDNPEKKGTSGKSKEAVSQDVADFLG